MLAEQAAWLPSVLAGPNAEWLPADSRTARVRLSAHGETVGITIESDATGRARAFSFPRWGNPDGGAFAYHTFGVIVEEERTFGGYTIPSRARAGWHFGTERFEKDGVFFRATIDAAEFR